MWTDIGLVVSVEGGSGITEDARLCALGQSRPLMGSLDHEQ